MEKLVVVYDVKGMFPNQYQQVMRDLTQSGEAAPDGRLNHFASAQEGGMVVVDVWESQQKLERFAGVLIPILVKNSVPPPVPQIHPWINQVDG
jgi:hypothetical protein